MEIKFYELDHPAKLKYSVIVSKDTDGLVMVRHKKRDSWEIPGGHIEEGEEASAAAMRELEEEAGAVEYFLRDVCNYSVEDGGSISYGRLCYAEISRYADSLRHETAEVRSFRRLPERLTYPEIQPHLLNEVIRRLYAGVPKGADDDLQNKKR